MFQTIILSILLLFSGDVLSNATYKKAYSTYRVFLNNVKKLEKDEVQRVEKEKRELEIQYNSDSQKADQEFFAALEKVKVGNENSDNQKKALDTIVNDKNYQNAFNLLSKDLGPEWGVFERKQIKAKERAENEKKRSREYISKYKSITNSYHTKVNQFINNYDFSNLEGSEVRNHKSSFRAKCDAWKSSQFRLEKINLLSGKLNQEVDLMTKIGKTKSELNVIITEKSAIDQFLNSGSFLKVLAMVNKKETGSDINVDSALKSKLLEANEMSDQLKKARKEKGDHLNSLKSELAKLDKKYKEYIKMRKKKWGVICKDDVTFDKVPLSPIKIDS